MVIILIIGGGGYKIIWICLVVCKKNDIFYVISLFIYLFVVFLVIEIRRVVF